MMKFLFVLAFLLIFPILISESFSYFDGDMINYEFENKNNYLTNTNSEIIQFNEFSNEQQMKRYIIFGKGTTEFTNLINTQHSISSPNGFFSIVTAPESIMSFSESKGLTIIEDFQLDFHSKYISKDNVSKLFTIENIANSERVHTLYNVTGKDVTIAIIDTGVDFSNPDMQHSLARDSENIPIMLDPDGRRRG